MNEDRTATFETAHGQYTLSLTIHEDRCVVILKKSLPFLGIVKRTLINFSFATLEDADNLFDSLYFAMELQ